MEVSEPGKVFGAPEIARELVWLLQSEHTAAINARSRAPLGIFADAFPVSPSTWLISQRQWATTIDTEPLSWNQSILKLKEVRGLKDEVYLL